MVGLWTWMHRGPTDTSVTLSYYACGRRLVASLLTVKRFHPALVIPCTNRTPPWVLANDYVGCGDSGPGGYKSVWAELTRTEMTRYAALVPRDGTLPDGGWLREHVDRHRRHPDSLFVLEVEAG